MFKEFIEIIAQYKTIGVFSHIRPDGDCIGAQVALCRWLQKNGHQGYAFNDDDVPANLNWLTEFSPIQKPSHSTLEKCSLFILLDGNSPERFGSYNEWQKKNPRPSVMIDHHPDPEDAFDLQISEPGASSTCELIYNLFKESDITLLDPDTAKALYTGIITDTGSLQFDSVTPETVEIVADLLRQGKFSPDEVIEKIYANKSLNQLNLFALALQSICLYENNQIAVISVTTEMLAQTHTTNSDTEGFVNYPLNIAGVKAVVFAKETDDGGIKMSLRSRSNIDVNIWARELNGGGHKKAAGAWHPGPLKKAIREAVQIGAKQLNDLEATTSE